VVERTGVQLVWDVRDIPTSHSFSREPTLLEFGRQINCRFQSGTPRLPFGRTHINPVAANDAAEVAAANLFETAKKIGKLVELTGPCSVDMYDHAKEYSEGLGRPISYVEITLQAWKDELSKESEIPDHTFQHIAMMAKLHSEGDYDLFTDSVQKILGRPAVSISVTLQASRTQLPYLPNKSVHVGRVFYPNFSL
jgi:NAD(P)H dehydrogenase (quinone)